VCVCVAAAAAAAAAVQRDGGDVVEFVL
jgi:hypothetical protein